MGKGCCPVCMHPLEKASTPVSLLLSLSIINYATPFLHTHSEGGSGRIPQELNSKYVALGKTNFPQDILHSSYIFLWQISYFPSPPFWHSPTRWYHHHWRQISASAVVFPNHHHHLANFVFPSKKTFPSLPFSKKKINKFSSRPREMAVWGKGVSSQPFFSFWESAVCVCYWRLGGVEGS